MGRRRAARLGADRRRRDPAARPRAHPRVGRGRRRLDGHRPPRRRGAVAVLRVDARTTPRSGSTGSAATRCTSSCCAPTASRGPVTVKVRDDFGGCRSFLEITRDLPFEGTPGALRRGVRPRRRGDRARRRRQRHARRSPGVRLTGAAGRPDSRGVSPSASAAAGDCVGALADRRGGDCARASRTATGRARRRRDLGAAADRPAARPAPPRRDRAAPSRSSTGAVLAGPDTRGPGGFLLRRVQPRAGARRAGPAGRPERRPARGRRDARRRRRRARLRPRRPRRRRRRRARPRRRAGPGEPAVRLRAARRVARTCARRPSARSSAPAATASCARPRCWSASPRSASLGAWGLTPDAADAPRGRRRGRPDGGQREGAALRPRRASARSPSARAAAPSSSRRSARSRFFYDCAAAIAGPARLAAAVARRRARSEAAERDHRRAGHPHRARLRARPR